MNKVKFFDIRVRERFIKYGSAITGFIAVAVMFVDIPPEHKITYGVVLIIILSMLYVYLWFSANKIKNITLTVEGSTVNITTGDIFKAEGFKAIAFNEDFDTLVDDKMISSHSLNGIFLKEHLSCTVAEIDNYIDS